MTRKFPIKFTTKFGGSICTAEIEIEPSFEMLDLENKADALVKQAQEFVNESYRLGAIVACEKFSQKHPDMTCLS